MRRLVSESTLQARQLVLPVFLREGAPQPVEIASMPGVVQHSRDSLRRAAAEAVAAGVGGIMLIGVPSTRDGLGSGATDPGGVLAVGLADLVAEVGNDTVVMGDLCLDEFTDHGHCGVLGVDGGVDNDATLQRYRDMAVVMAQAGGQVVGPSGMMDGQVGAIRGALDMAGFDEVELTLSSLTGPLRPPAGCAPDACRRRFLLLPLLTAYSGNEHVRNQAADELRVKIGVVQAADELQLKIGVVHFGGRHDH